MAFLQWVLLSSSGFLVLPSKINLGWGMRSIQSWHVGVLSMPTSTMVWGHVPIKLKCPKRPSGDF